MFLRRSLFAATAAALFGSVGFASPMQPAPIVRAEAPRPRREAKRISRSSPTSFQFGYLKHGPTTAQQQRAAKKARNVKRHKQHVRGRA